MIYEQEIINAYRHLPVLGLSDLRYGDIINTTPGDVPSWPPGSYFMRMAAKEIVRYTGRLWPSSQFIYSTHSIIMQEGSKYFEVTVPEARFGDLQEEGLRRDEVYIICRYRWQRIEQFRQKIPFEVVYEYLEGTGYDYGQLVAILVNDILGYSVVDYLPFLDISRRRKVCSVGALTAWLAWWYDQGERQGHPMPGSGSMNVERVPPGIFENDAQFEIVGILDGGFLS